MSAAWCSQCVRLQPVEHAINRDEWRCNVCGTITTGLELVRAKAAGIDVNTKYRPADDRLTADVQLVMLVSAILAFAITIMLWVYQ